MLPPSPTPCRQVLVRAPSSEAPLQAGIFYPVTRLRQPTPTSDLQCTLSTGPETHVVDHGFFARHEDGLNIVVLHLN